jgi:glycerate 2-kinase
MSDVRQNLQAIYTAAIAAVDPETAVSEHLSCEKNILTLSSSGRVVRSVKLSPSTRVYVVGAGKATASMARAVERILAGRISEGCICVKHGYTRDLAVIEQIEASHPVPDESGMRGARKILDLLGRAGKEDLVISLISGGGSALLPLPPEGITLQEKREVTTLLLKSGATIHEVNMVRKHLSLVKGGTLARAAGRSAVLNLMISDVVGDDMDVIASGPFVPDRTTFSDALGVLGRYGLADRVPAPVAKRIRAGARGEIEENPGEGSPVFAGVTNLIIASNIMALEAARAEASRRGYGSLILSSMIEGDAREAAHWHSRIAREIRASSNPVRPPACVVSGGETTVKVTGDGLGGRNMEFAMHAALLLEGTDGITMASIGTDGTDGPTDAAGALADGATAARARGIGIDIGEFIRNNDSYHFHERMGTLIKTGPTNTNVMDVRIMIVE